MKYVYLLTCLVQLFICFRIWTNIPKDNKLPMKEVEDELRETRMFQQSISDLRIYAQYYTEMKRREKFSEEDKLKEQLLPMWLVVLKYEYTIWDVETARYLKGDMYTMLKEEYESGRPLYNW